MEMSLYTPKYLKEQRRMHALPTYGAASRKWAEKVGELIDLRQPSTILDYGAGKGVLRETLGGFLLLGGDPPATIGPVLEGRDWVEYDPGVKAIAKLPRRKFDMVCCIDVLEHIEPECLEEVLQSIRDRTGGFAFLTIHTGPAGKFLSDGRNAHLIQRPVGWWLKQLGMFKVVDTGSVAMTHWLVCE
jgi:2-polyprenyl-3-methyl-5-hydroxy-6-metoxy-1,4-benzoquinol methylase